MKIKNFIKKLIGKNSVKKIIGGGYSLLIKIWFYLPHKESELDASRSEETLHNIRENRPCVIECNNRLKPECDLMIVIPAYNVEKYITECINSILSQQTEYTFQVVIIDDGSCDDTLGILVGLSDPRITVIHQENGGIANARNRGLEVITGNYVMFVDSDDILYPGAVQALLEKAYLLKADIVEGGSATIDATGRVMKTEQYPDTTDNEDNPRFRGQPWGRVIRSELFQKIHYPNGFEYEDSIFAYCILPAAEHKYDISDIVYGYRVNDSSITHTSKRASSCIDTYYISMYLWRWYAEHFEITEIFNKKILNQISLNFIRTTRCGKEVLQAAYCLEREIYLELFSQKFRLSGKHKSLDRALRDNNWGAYKLICSGWSFMDK